MRPILSKSAALAAAVSGAWIAAAQEVAPAPAAPAATVPQISPAPASPAPAAPAPGGGVLLNFQNASLNDVLTYLSEAAGFVIVQEAPVSGTVNIVSRQPLTPEESVDLLNTVLVEKGYTAIRNGRILKIVNRRDAQRRDLPVEMGSDPARIPRRDEVVTQILPVRFGEVAKLVENLRPLLPESASISANDSSNAILLTDTQTNIRRIAQIIKALDTSTASISGIHVFPLRFADAKEVATLVTQLFSGTATGQQQQNGGRRGGGGFGGFGGQGGPGGGGGGGGGGPAQSEARAAASRVVAVADEQSNSLIVSAPDETIPGIEDIIKKIDTSITAVTDSRIFRLRYADAVELAAIITSLYSDTSTQNNGRNGNTNNNGRRGGQQGGGFGGFPGFGGAQPAQGSQQTQRELLQSKVVAVGDPRTNSLIVTAAHEQMSQIAEMVGRLDATDAKKQHVYTHSLQHADAGTVADVLRGMLGQQTNSNSSQAGTNVLTQRSANGATLDTAGTTNQGRTGQ